MISTQLAVVGGGPGGYAAAFLAADRARIFHLGDRRRRRRADVGAQASHERSIAVEALLGERVIFEPRAIPAVVFTDPELAWCGLTEAQAAKENRGVAVARFPWGASGRAITIDRTDGLTKLVIDPETERILGVGLVGSGAGELIAEGVLAIEMRATATDVRLSIPPTLTETVMEAVEVFFGQATHVHRPRKGRS